MADYLSDVRVVGPAESAATPAIPDRESGLLTDMDLLADWAGRQTSEPDTDIRALLRQAAFRALI
jgi:hypothetical protein